MKTERYILFIALLLVVFGYLSVNLPLSIFPEVMTFFNASREGMQLNMAAFFYSYAFSQLMWGALDDMFGTKKILLISTTIAIFGALICLFSFNLTSFFLGRLVESIGIGSVLILARAVLGDWQSGKQLGASFIYMMSLAALMPGVMPFLSASIFTISGSWRAIFVAQSLMGLLVFLCVLFLYQNKPEMVFKSTAFKGIFRRYFLVLIAPNFARYFLIYGLTLGLLMNFYTIGPYVFLKDLHLQHHEYGLIALTIGFAYFMGAMFSRILLNKLTMHGILKIGLGFCVVSVILFLMAYLYLGFSVISMFVPVSFFSAGCGLIGPASNALALNVAPEKGSASALVGGVVMVAAAGFSGLMAKLPLNSVLTYVVIFGVATVAALLLELVPPSSAG